MFHNHNIIQVNASSFIIASVKFSFQTEHLHIVL
jgi:hypothetical protein